ncbi:hypothetical protein LPB19_11125 [Marinobacter salinisoli]|uniref:FimV N-terminal domain-containing protein n=1 Tax=Marinobacter salinisoli TaxID=2769486 RepID=A0ABX7MNA8_9GAMM|nr:FimV/HubP family polar landmark protein [Marinobacter salinisoli]QSP93750.1 hypothetical protein LPB19_11125 [Marinobacter salinisoli]
MKVRKLAVALALAGGLGSGVAQALGLGEIELQSYLNEPLDAEIRLPQSRGVDPTDVFVNIAPESAYETVGLSRNQFLSKLRFQVVTQNDGSLAVRVFSREPLREPYLNFLLELTWPSGRLMREYAVLVDPPVYAEDSGVQESVSAPTSTAAAPQSSESRSQESVRRQAEAEASLGRGYQANTLGPTGSSDTLWAIAERIRPNNSVTTQQVMIAIQDLNPDSFIGGNINRLKRGEVLRVPTLEQIQSRSRAEVTRMVGQQNREFQSPQRTVDATDTQVALAEATSQAQSGGDELKLVVAEAGSREANDGGSAGGDGQLSGGVDAGAAVALEELESARRENEELSGRVQDLEGQIETLQRLIELKNSQLADLQSMTQDQEGQPVGDAPANGETPQGSKVEGADASPANAEGADESIATDGAGDSAEAETAAAELSAEEAAGEGLDEAAVESEAVSADLEADAEELAGEAEVSAVEAGAGSDEQGSEVEPASEVASQAETEVGSQPAETAPMVAQTSQVTEPAQPSTASAPVDDKGPIAGIIEAIKSNMLYQVALGGGLILLLLLLLVVARRNANREKAFYEQLNQDSDTAEDDDFELSLDDEPQESANDSAIAEADNYLAFGRHDQAAQALEEAISREPSRTDLRLKLLGIYAEIQNQASFDKQYAELESLNDDQAMAVAQELRASLDDAEAIPSIDDLESQLRSDSFGAAVDESNADFASAADAGAETHLSDELLADQYDAQQEEKVEDEFGALDSDFANFDLNEVEDRKADSQSQEPQEAGQASADEAIEFDLSDLSLEPEEAPEAGKGDDEAEFGSLSMQTEEDSGSLDFELEEAGESVESELDSLERSLDFDLGDSQSEKASLEVESLEDDSGLESLDESFLDELDAELDKVAGEGEAVGDSSSEEGGLDELELDVSDEDLALMEEFSEASDSGTEEQASASALDESLSLEDTLVPESDAATDSAEEEVAAAEELEALASLDSLEEPEVPVTSDTIDARAKSSAVADIDEGDLGEDDDFDFLAGTDEAATKLDLARAYMEMGDADGARDILEEVSLEGNEEQKSEAQDLLKNLA